MSGIPVTAPGYTYNPDWSPNNNFSDSIDTTASMASGIGANNIEASEAYATAGDVATGFNLVDGALKAKNSWENTPQVPDGTANAGTINGLNGAADGYGNMANMIDDFPGLGIGIKWGLQPISQLAHKISDDFRNAAKALQQAFAPTGGPATPPTPVQAPKPTYSDPLVLDLSGAGIDLTSLSGSQAYFDYSGTGIATETGWIGAGQGLLVMAPTSGVVTAANLLGAESGNGFADLAALDTNGDGVIDSQDASYAQLRVWVDANGDGVSASGELFSLADLGISSISVANGSENNSSVISSGNNVISTGSFTVVQNGVTSSHTIAEVNFATTSQIVHIDSSGTQLTDDAKKLPNLTGFGLLPDLDVAMSTDNTLEQMVYNLVANAATMTGSDFDAAFQAIVFQWAGVTNTDPTSYGPYIDAREMGVVLAYFGIDPSVQTQYQNDPGAHNASAIWIPTYQKILDSLEVRFASQIAQSYVNYGFDVDTAFSTAYAPFALLGYNSETNLFVGNIDNLGGMIGMLAPADQSRAATYWGQVDNIISKLGMDFSSTSADGFVVDSSGYSVIQDLLQFLSYNRTEDSINTIASYFGEIGVSVFDSATSNISALESADDSVIYFHGSNNIVGAHNGDVLIAGNDTTAISLTGPTNWGATRADDIVLEKAWSIDDVTFSMQGNSLIVNYSDGSSLSIGGFFSSSGEATATIHFNGGTAISNVDILNSILANETTDGDDKIESFAVGGLISGGAGNDTLISNPNFFANNGLLPADNTAGYGVFSADGGSGNNVIVLDDSISYNDSDGSYDLTTSYNANTYENRILYNVTSNDLVVTSENYDFYLSYLVRSGLAPAAAGSDLTLLTKIETEQYGNPYGIQVASHNVLSFGAGISASDVTISAAGALDLTQAALFDSTPDYQNDINAAEYMNGLYQNYGYTLWSVTPWSLLVTTGSGSITFTGTADQLQEIDFADGTVLTARQISDEYVQSEETQGFATIMGTELGNTLQGGSSDQVLIGLSGDDTLIAGAGSDTLMGGFGHNTYSVSAGSGDVTVANDRYHTSEYGLPTPTVGLTELDDVLALGAGIDPSGVIVTRAQSLDPSVTGLTDILITVSSTGQTIRLVDEDQSLYTYNAAVYGNNSAAVGSIKFANGVVWSVSDLLGKVDQSSVVQEAESRFPDFTPIVGGYGDDTLSAGSVQNVLAGGFGSDTYVVNSGDANVVIDDELGGFSGDTGDVLDGAVSQTDRNVLEFGPGISEADITVSQASDGTDLVLTDVATGQVVTLAGQLSASAGSIVSEVDFSDGSSLSNADLFNMSVASAISSGADVIYASRTIGSLNVGSYSGTLVGNNIVLGSAAEVLDMQGDASITFTTDAATATINYEPSASGTSDVLLYFSNGWVRAGDSFIEVNVKASYSADGSEIYLQFSDPYVDASKVSLTINSATGLSGFEYQVYSNYSWLDTVQSLANLQISEQDAVAGDVTMTVTHDNLIVKQNGFANLITSTGNGETFIYGGGALTIDETDTASAPENSVETSYYGVPSPSEYTITAAGDLDIDFGGGNTLTILHEFESDGTVSSNGIQEIAGIDAETFWLQDRRFNAASGQSALVGDGGGGIFDTKGIATTVSDSGSSVDTIIFNRGYGSVTVGEVSQNNNDTISFGSGISFEDLNFSLDANGGIIISLGNGDQIDIVNGLGFVQPLNGGYGIANLSFADGSTAWFNTSWNWTDSGWQLGVTAQADDGSSFALDTTNLLQSTLLSPAGPAVFTAGGAVENIVGTGGADTINFVKGDGVLTISETSPSGPATSVLNVNATGLIFSDDVWAQGTGGGAPLAFAVSNVAASSESADSDPSAVPELGGMIGVTANDAGDVTLLLGDGDRVTLLGQLAGNGGVNGVSQIVATDGFGWTDTWTNSDIVAALAYEAETGIVPDGESAGGGGVGPVSNVVMMSATTQTSASTDDKAASLSTNLAGGATPSTLDGSAGNMSVTAGSAGDTIIGGNGDTLYGGAGADTFVFHAGFGQETISGFVATGARADVLQFDTGAFADWAHLLGATTQQGSDLLITLDASDSVLVKNLSLSNFSQANAHFV